MQIIDETALDELALGAAVLGTGGGGDPYIGKIMSRQAIREYGPIQLMELDELEDDDLVVPSAMMGAPTVMVEKMPSGDDCSQRLRDHRPLLETNPSAPR